MVKLKRTLDGKILDCSIAIDSNGFACAVYFENNAWTAQDLNCFVPAEAGKDY